MKRFNKNLKVSEIVLLLSVRKLDELETLIFKQSSVVVLFWLSKNACLFLILMVSRNPKLLQIVYFISLRIHEKFESPIWKLDFVAASF
jgi:hypothetical protein